MVTNRETHHICSNTGNNVEKGEEYIYSLVKRGYKYNLSQENKKVLSPFYRKKNLIENECKTPIGFLIFR